MFNENTLKDIEIIDSLISLKNRELFKKGSNLFLSWTFPTNHLHEQQITSTNYFVVWVGKTGKGTLKSVCFGPVNMVLELLENVSETELIKKLKNNDNR